MVSVVEPVWDVGGGGSTMPVGVSCGLRILEDETVSRTAGVGAVDVCTGGKVEFWIIEVDTKAGDASITDV